MPDESSKSFKRNILIMALPAWIPAIPIMIGFGESAALFAIPLFINSALAALLAKRLDTKDAIAYPIVQYPFFVLLFYLLAVYTNVGLGLIIVIPMIYIINTALVFAYFWLARNKTWCGKALTMLFTLIITLALYSEHYGPNRHTSMLVRLLVSIFGQ